MLEGIDHVQLAAHVGVEAGFSPAHKAHPANLRLGLRRAAEPGAAASVEITDDDSIPGVRRCYLVDPWGNRIEFVSA